MEVYSGQTDGVSEKCSETRVAMWNTFKTRKVNGNAAPRQDKVDQYLYENPGEF